MQYEEIYSLKICNMLPNLRPLYPPIDGVIDQWPHPQEIMLKVTSNAILMR